HGPATLRAAAGLHGRQALGRAPGADRPGGGRDGEVREGVVRPFVDDAKPGGLPGPDRARRGQGDALTLRMTGRAAPDQRTRSAAASVDPVEVTAPVAGAVGPLEAEGTVARRSRVAE